MTHRVVFLGSPEFALPSLRALVDDERFDIPLVVTQPDRPAGRGRKMTPPPVAAFACEAKLPLLQPPTLKDDTAYERLVEAKPDLLIVVAYGEILNRRVLDEATHGALNIHPSLLPAYRGASPIPAAILNGDTRTGVSIIKLVRRLDSGPVLAQFPVDVDEEATTGTLSEQLARLAALHLPNVADSWIRGEISAVEQSEEQATYTTEWKKSDARVDWTKSAASIDRLVRAALPWPVAWTLIEDSRLQIRWSRTAHVDPDGLTHEPGTVLERDGRVYVATGSGWLELVTVQPESKRAMDALSWVKGLPAKAVRFLSEST